MGIHYDYKSTRGDKAMKKKLSAARIEQRRAKNHLIILKQKKIKSCMILTNLSR